MKWTVKSQHTDMYSILYKKQKISCCYFLTFAFRVSKIVSTMRMSAPPSTRPAGTKTPLSQMKINNNIIEH